MGALEQTADAERRGGSALAGIALGLIGLVAIWIATPYNDYVLANTRIANSELPAAALFLTVLLVLGANPLLRTIRPAWSLTRGQLAIALGMMLVGCTITQNIRVLPFALSRAVVDAAGSPSRSEGYKRMGLPPSLLPEQVEYDRPAPAAEHVLAELPAGESIPWAKWLGPLTSWGVFLVFCWLMMIGMALVLFHQWRANERLAFPLLTLHQAILAPPAPGRRLNPLFSSRAFWGGVAAVFALHLLAGGNIYFPEQVPGVPLFYNISALFTEPPLSYLPWYLKVNRVYFTFLGVAYFMPSRIGFSIWFFVIFYGLYEAFGYTYFPPYHWRTVQDQRTGTMLALAIIILWLGRRHWGQVFRLALGGRPGGDGPSAERARRDRLAGRMFLVGAAGMFAWLVWVGVEPVWAVCFVAFALMLSLLITRLVAETGLPMFGFPADHVADLIRLAPVRWFGPVSAFFAWIIGTLFGPSGRVDVTALATHGLALDDDARPRRQARSALGWVPMLAVGLVISGAAHLTAAYHHTTSINHADPVINPWGTNQFVPANNMLAEWQAGRWNRHVHNSYLHLGIGATMASLLYWACLAMPTWPVHPVGMLMVNTWWGSQLWFSVCLGWLAKVLIVRLGGARLYSRARTLFLGLIVGEVLAMIFWAVIPGLLAATGHDYKVVPVLPF